MIEKQLIVLIPKSQEEEFKKLIDGFELFTISSYEKEQKFKRKTLSLQVSATKSEDEDN